MTTPTTSPVESLAMHRAEMRAEVYKRYKVLKDKGTNEESARNIAAAQCATMPGNIHRAEAYKRELIALITPKRRYADAIGKEAPYNWRNPI